MTRRSVLRDENPVVPGLQSYDIADPQFPIPGRVDLDHGLAPGQSDFGALNRAEGPDMPYLAQIGRAHV